MHSAAEQTITFNCPSCGTKLRVPSEMANQIGPCPVCNAMISAPDRTPPHLREPAPQKGASPAPPQGPSAPPTGPASAPPPPSQPSLDDDLPSPGSSPVYQPPTGPSSPPQQPSYPDVTLPGWMENGPEETGPQQPGPGTYDGGHQSSTYPPYQGGGQQQDYDAPADEEYDYEEPSGDYSGGYHGDEQDSAPGYDDYGRGDSQPYPAAPQTDSQPYGGSQPGTSTSPAAPPLGQGSRYVQQNSDEEKPLHARKRPFPVFLVVLFVGVIGAIGFLLYKLEVVDMSALGLSAPTTEQPDIQVDNSPLMPSITAEADGGPGTVEGPAPTGPTAGAPSVEDPQTPAELVGKVPSLSSEQGGISMDGDSSLDQGAGSLPTSKLAAPRKTIQRFLQAATWEERLPFIYNGEELKDKIREYHQSHEDAAILDYRLDFFHTEVNEETGSDVFVFFLTFAQDQDGFPIVVIEKDGNHGLDWELFVEFRDRHFKTFVEEQRKSPESFRVVIWRVTYWPPDRDQIPDVDSLICYRIDPPYSGFTQFAFVPKDTEKGQSLLNKLSWQADPLAAEVEMHWEKFPNGRPYLTIDRILSTTWVKP